MKARRIFFALLALTVLVGCASNNYVSPHFVVTGGVTTIGAGREVAVVELCRLAEVASPERQEELRTNPSLAKCTERSLQFALGTSLGRDVVTGSAPVVLGSIIQGQYGLAISRNNARLCQGGRCAGGGAQSAAGASSVANVSVVLPCSATGSCAQFGN